MEAEVLSHQRDGGPTPDELAGIAWWNNLGDAERAQALRDAGWQPGGTDAPSAADAWAEHKRRPKF